MSVGSVHSKPGSPCPLMPTAAKRATVSRPRFSLRVCFHYAYATWFALMNCYPLALLALPLGPFSFSPDCLQSNQLLLLLVAGCWLRVAAAGAYVAPPSPTNADGDDVSRRAQTRAEHPLSLALPLQFPFLSSFLFLSISPPSLSPFLSLSFSLSLMCVPSSSSSSQFLES